MNALVPLVLGILFRLLGKTTCLSYILVRLPDQKPTIHCNHKNVAYVLTDAGVRCLGRKIDASRHPTDPLPFSVHWSTSTWA